MTEILTIRSWRYGPDGAARIFEAGDEVPDGWFEHPSAVGCGKSLENMEAERDDPEDYPFLSAVADVAPPVADVAPPVAEDIKSLPMPPVPEAGSMRLRRVPRQ
jgi:hypothetical protein